MTNADAAQPVLGVAARHLLFNSGTRPLATRCSVLVGAKRLTGVRPVLHPSHSPRLWLRPRHRRCWAHRWTAPNEGVPGALARSRPPRTRLSHTPFHSSHPGPQALVQQQPSMREGSRDKVTAVDFANVHAEPRESATECEKSD